MPEESCEIRLGGLVVVPEERRAFFAGAEMALTGREYAILLQLASRPGWVFSAEQLAGDDPLRDPSPLAVNVHVTHLRAKLARAGAAPSLIETVRGSGWRLRGALARERGAASTSLGSFVGRESELDVLRRSVESGSGRLAVVLGEPGIGKTSLVEKLLNEVAPHFEVFRVVCDGNGSGDHWLWRQALGEIERRTGVRMIDQLEGDLLVRLLGDSTVSSGSPSPALAADRALAYDAVGRYLEVALSGMSRPTLVFIDDLQWADDASLKLLSFLSGRLGQIPGAVVASCRSADASLRRPLSKIVEYASHRRDATLVTLDGLAACDVETLVRERLGDQDAEQTALSLWERTSGNALFVHEYLRVLSDSEDSVVESARLAAPSVCGLVRDQVTLFAESTQAILKLAAVAGVLFDPTVVLQASGLSEDTASFDTAVRANLIVPDGPMMRFRHALVRDALLEGLDVSELQRLHGDMATAMRSLLLDSETRVFRLAHHYARATSADRLNAVGYLIAAARLAAFRLAFEDALSHLQEALRLLESSGIERERGGRVRSAILERLGGAHAALQDWPAARRDYASAVNARPKADALAHARLNTRLGAACVYERRRGDCSHAFALAISALDEVPERAGAWWRAWIEVRLWQAEAAYVTDLPLGPKDVRTELGEPVQRYGTLEQKAKYFAALATEAYTRGRYTVTEECIEAQRAALEHAQRGGSHYLQAQMTGLLGSYLVQHGETGEGAVRLRESIDLSRRCGDVLGEEAALWFLSLGARADGDVRQVEMFAHELQELTVASRVGLLEFSSGAKGQQAWVALRRHQDGEAAELAEQALLEWQADPSCSQAVWVMAWPAVACALRTGDVVHAVECATLMTRSDQEVQKGDLDTRLGAAVALYRRGAEADAKALLHELETEAQEYGYT